MTQPTTNCRRLAWVLALGIVVATSAAHAEDISATEHAKRAKIAFDLQDWKTAAAEYQEAYRVEQRPEYLWGLAQVQRQSGDCAAAIKTYKAFARSVTNPNQVSAAETNIAKCEADLAKSEKTSVPPPKADAAAANATPAPAAPATTKAPAPPPLHWYNDGVGHALVLTGTAAAVTGTVFLVRASSAEPDSKDETVSRVLGYGGLVVGGTLIVDGILRYLLIDGAQPRGDHSPRVSASVGPRAAGLVLTGQF